VVVGSRRDAGYFAVLRGTAVVAGYCGVVSGALEGVLLGTLVVPNGAFG
jgi:hypothetical protein